MLSAEDIAAVKLAIVTCNNPELKREVLCIPGSDNYINKPSDEVTNNKKKWDEIIEKRSAIIIENLGLPLLLKETVIKFVPLVGIRMLTWAEYHERTLGFSREYSIKVLSGSFFTSQGIINNEKAAELLIKDKNLTIKQKYKLACHYFIDDIPVLYSQMSKEDKEEFYDAQYPGRINQPGLVKFWSYYLMGEIDKLKGDRNRDLYLLEKAIESGNKVTVKYCFEKTDLIGKKYVLVHAALKAMRNRRTERNDWIVFRDPRYDSKKTWVPGDYYMNILCFLLSKMTEDQQMHFFKLETSVLECYLHWPYQNCFMNTAKLMWEFLPESDYAVLLLRICDKIETKYGTLDYGEDGSHNYRRLLMEFWCQSPEHFKRYVFNQNVYYRIYEGKTVVALLFMLLSLKNFTHEDRKNIKLILASADDKEKENITSLKQWKDICIGLIEEGKWEILDQFVLNWFSSKEEANKFKRQLSMNQDTCLNFVENRWNAVEAFIRWIALPEEEINKLKKEMIYSQYGTKICAMLTFVRQNMKAANKFCEWFFSSEDEFGKFKKEYFFSDMLSEYCSILTPEDKIEIADEFTKWCFSSEEDIKELKKNVAYKIGAFVCEKLISHPLVENIYDEEGNYTGDCTVKFKGGKWEQVEKFLTWCFTSEKEINDFKKNVLHGRPSIQIHFNLIKSNQWEEAETFFAWLGLSANEIKELKKETLFNHIGASEMFSELIYSEESDEESVEYGDKQDAIELLLRWYLTDKEAILKFKNEFKCRNRGKVTEKQTVVFEKFDFMIEQRLNDLDEEKREARRKSENCFPNEKLCNVELNNEAEYGK